MCGIAGASGSHATPGELAQVLQRMGQTLLHRGPDDAGQLLVPGMGAGLVSRRLSIVDLESGKQPIASEDDSVHVVVNGEIYNHRALRRELEVRGHRFRSNSDAEVVVHLYEELGPGFLPRLEGMFALAVLDTRHRRLLLARDRCGMKPLYYAQNRSSLLFASEIKALLAGGHPAEPDFSGIDSYLALGYVPAPRTCFRGVQKLPAGHCLLWQEDGVSCQPFWRFVFEPAATRKADGAYAEELQSLLDAAVASHLQADVPVGMLISGGLDSSLVAVAASRHREQRFKTFSVVFPEAPEVDERPYQQAMAEHLGSEHHEVEFRASDIPRLAAKAIFHQDVPSLSFPSIVQWRLAELAAATVKTVLSGEGSDELFAGYAWYRELPYRSLRRVVPPALARLPANYVTHVKWGRFFRVLAAGSDTAAEAEVFRIFTPREKSALFGRVLPLGRNDLAPLQLDPETAASCNNRLQMRMAMGFTRTLCDGLLMVNDRISMAHSLEVRMPFLDNAIVDFARRLPPDLTRRGDQEKYVLSLLRGQLPQAVARRRKQPLSAPDHRYFRGPLRAWARDVLLGAAAGGPLNRHVIGKRLDGWLDGSDYYIRRVRALVAFQLWWNQFFEHPGSVPP